MKGQDPSSSSLLEFVLGSSTSVRLRNSIIDAASGGRLPFETIADYLAAGDLGPDVMRRAVKNLGRKSAAELHKLVYDNSAGLLSLREELRTKIYSAAGEIATDEVVVIGLLPVRLARAVESLGFAKDTLRANLEHLDERCSLLAAQQNVGNDSTLAWRVSLRKACIEWLAQVGLPEGLASAAARFLLLGEIPTSRDLDALARSQFAGSAAGPLLASTIPQTAFASAEALIDEALLFVRPREREIIENRFGLGCPKQTLEEVGQRYKVTRERIRQIEAKAIRWMRAKYRVSAERTAIANAGKLWQMIAVGGALTPAELDGRGKHLTAAWMILLQVAGLSLYECVAYFATPFRGGWLDPDLQIADIEAAEAQLINFLADRLLPAANTVLDERIGPIALRFCGRYEYGGYLLANRPGPRMRRALRAHALLARHESAIDIVVLAQRMRSRFADDACSSRDLEIVMNSNPHLFLEIRDGIWAGIGAASMTLLDQDLNEAPFEADTDDDDEASGDLRQTNANAIEATLRHAGPLKLSEMLLRADDMLPPGRSANSIAPTLITNKERFERPLPGLYALAGQIPSGPALATNPPNYLLDPDQIRVYAMARHAGEPWGSFSLWCPEMECGWALWASRHAEPPILDALLSVAVIDAWPLEPSEIARWQQLAGKRARYGLASDAREDSFVLPDINAILSACIVLRERGLLGWIAANRILLRRLTDHTSVGLLAVLVSLGILSPQQHWQDRHQVGPDLHHWFQQLESERHRRGVLQWQSVLGQKIQQAVRQLFHPHGWVTNGIIEKLFDGDALVLEPPSPTVMDFIEDERRKGDDAGFERLLENLRFEMTT